MIFQLAMLNYQRVYAFLHTEKCWKLVMFGFTMFRPSPRLAKPVTVGHAGGCGKVHFDALSFKLGPWWERLLWPTKMWGLFTWTIWTPLSCKDLGHPWSNCHKNGNTSQLEDWIRALNHSLFQNGSPRPRTCPFHCWWPTGASCTPLTNP